MRYRIDFFTLTKGYLREIAILARYREKWDLLLTGHMYKQNYFFPRAKGGDFRYASLADAKEAHGGFIHFE